jgi:hypothetical protein
MRVIEELYDGVSTSELDNLAAEQHIGDHCASGLYAAKSLFELFIPTKSFSETMTEMFNY